MKQTAAFLNSLLSSRVASSTTLGCLCSLTFIASAPVAEASNSHQESFNVQTYGAKGDGVTDDTSAVQAALVADAKAGGGTVIFPNGQYLYSDPLTVNVAFAI